MVEDLDRACLQSTDPSDSLSLPVIQVVRTGRRGRPPKQIQRQFLAYALEMRGPTEIGRMLQCSRRTVRREALRLGLAEPGPPVFSSTTTREGDVLHHHTSVTAPVSTLSDDELDHAILAILSTFPHFGRWMIKGHLAAQGHRVPRQRIRESYIRLRGVPPAFGQRVIVRKKYQVPGPNSLVHHDGQHGMISFSTYVAQWHSSTSVCSRSYPLEIRDPLLR